MFTAEHIKNAHSKVKSGADFPMYIKEIKAMGVTRYETFVKDGRVDFFGAADHCVQIPEKYNPITIADHADIKGFKSGLLDHQQVKTDYPTFIAMCANTGIDKWKICMDKMTCTYFDKSGNIVLEEKIPQ